MHFSTFLLMPLAALSIASPLAERAAPSKANAVLADLNDVYAKIQALNTTLNGFTKNNPLNTATALKIQSQTNDVGDALQKTTADTNASGPFTSSESTAIATNVLQKLQPGTYSLLDNIVAHKPQFASGFLFVGDLTKTVRADLVKQKGLSGQLGDALAKKLFGVFGQLAPQINKQIADKFDASIKKFDTCTGLLCLPDVSGLPIPRDLEVEA